MLDLSFTNLSGKIPNSIGYLNSLRDIRDLIDHLKSLRWLGLLNTKFSGEIPDSISHLKFLVALGLSYTIISEEIPDSITHLKFMTKLDLSFTNLSGEIPDSIGDLESLEFLVISDTNMSAEIPDSISNFKSLFYLDLHSNMMKGSLLPSICNNTYLRYFDISNNRLHGVITQCSRNISLTMVDFFRGTIPNAWDGCGDLEGLLLNGNSLEGEVPSGLSKCKSLKVLDLGNNHLNGTFPHSLANLQNLQVLVLKSNNFHGPIDNSSVIKHPFSSLKVFEVFENKFVGLLPKKYFQNFDAMNNVVNKGRIPKYVEIGKFYPITIVVKGSEVIFLKISVVYTIVDLSSNLFEEEIPNVIGSLHTLIALNLSHNNLESQIPKSMGILSTIELLDLSSNRLTKEISKSLSLITTLEVLDLSQNHLMGHIPDGTQFRTFDATSFEGNPGLCWFPLPKQCEHPSVSHIVVDGDDESGFTWKVVMLGYGCGTLLGLVVGYMMLSTGRPTWFNTFDDDLEYMIQKRQKKEKTCLYRKMKSIP
ncbi:hypothetical protein OSB04_027880 [Centaurea solstitialis]|uniref:Disease resistance R13L4/SHOC-2-like LRR domain-containing protein n=1 Tax=Centaurea solstitialis TaxID=347529 RepID=A0AA38SG64_9ASTR|nr:hypothetical protein OSB04_027880 [Centaurea solstitialis]